MKRAGCGRSTANESMTCRCVVASLRRRLSSYGAQDYFYTKAQNAGASDYDYLDSAITSLFSQQPGQDLTEALDNLELDITTFSANMACLDNVCASSRSLIRDAL